ncbi:MAG: 4Fe-4S binding protein [Thermodesulfovibrionales bacterium]|nr:4Fe-4S binding protein [Thermodesulfovibrionales bacterium]
MIQPQQIQSNNAVSKSSYLKYNIIRRCIMLIILMLFLLQIVNINILVGSLTGSVFLSYISLLDIFAYLETVFASKTFTILSFISVIPIIILYLFFGRAFCGWICPFDLLFSLNEKMRIFLTKKPSKKLVNNKKTISFLIAFFFLTMSALISIPVFTNYLSHLTNLYRAITLGYFAFMDLPFEISVFLFSFGMLLSFIVFDLFSPRLWCKVICPVGRTYGVFNKVSILTIKRDTKTCIQCRACDDVCYMEIKPSNKEAIRDMDCIMCGRCIDTCSKITQSMNFRLWRK